MGKLGLLKEIINMTKVLVDNQLIMLLMIFISTSWYVKILVRCQISHAKLLSLSSTSSNQWPFGLEANGAKGQMNSNFWVDFSSIEINLQPLGNHIWVVHRFVNVDNF
jgi:hypothetical protein